MDISDTDDPSVVGEEAHIVAREPDGPRGLSDLTTEQRDKYGNLILMCSIHHKVIDDHKDTYTIEKLHDIKKDHENWVKTTLHIDAKKQYEDEVYASYLDDFIRLADVENWLAWTSHLLSSDYPQMYVDTHKQLQEAVSFIASRVWFNRYPSLENAFVNFKSVLNDLLNVFDKYREKNEDLYSTKRIYRDGYGEPDLKNKMLEKYEYHVDLIEDLTYELTRAANYLFDKAREFILPSFRIKEGVLMVQAGPYFDFSWKTYRPEYSQNEKVDFPYPRLRAFMTERIDRQLNKGEGVSEDYFVKIY